LSKELLQSITQNQLSFPNASIGNLAFDDCKDSRLKRAGVTDF